jgi:hypothetical protein
MSLVCWLGLVSVLLVALVHEVYPCVRRQDTATLHCAVCCPASGMTCVCLPGQCPFALLQHQRTRFPMLRSGFTHIHKLIHTQQHDRVTIPPCACSMQVCTTPAAAHTS